MHGARGRVSASQNSLTRILLAALVAATALLLPHPPTGEARGLWQVMDREAYMITGDTRVVRTQYNLRNGENLRAVPYQLGRWHGADETITNRETFPQLEADHLIHRRYTDDSGRAVLLTLVGGSKGQSFHHPLICYQRAGWPTQDWGVETIPVPGGSVVMRAVVGKDPHGPWQADMHGFLWPTTSRGWEHGATMIRVTVLMRGDAIEDAYAVGRRFARHFFAEVAPRGAIR